MQVRVRLLRYDHPEVSEVIASDHCVLRFRRRRRIRAPGIDAVGTALQAVFEEADLTRWAPPWVDTSRRTELWALHEDLAFPLIPAEEPRTWLATTCLVRGQG